MINDKTVPLAELLVEYYIDNKADIGSLISGLSFLEALPRDFKLPEISPDGEGAVIFSWPNISVTIEYEKIHWVINPAKENPKHFNDVSFHGSRMIPYSLLDELDKE